MSKNAYGVGGGSSDTPGDVKCLRARATVAANYMTFETPAGIDYFVPAGRTFIITKLSFAADVANNGLIIGYGDDGVDNGAAAPTNPKEMTNIIKVPVADVDTEFNVTIPILATKYPFLKGAGAAVFCTVYGIEKTP